MAHEDSVHLSVSLVASNEHVMRHIMPSSMTDVLKSIFHLSLPVFLAMLFQYGMAFVSIAFSGYLNVVDLAATGLANSIISITAMGIGSGLATGYDIMGSQAFGASEFKKIGILLQKTWIILGLASCVIIAFWLNIGSLLKCWDEPPDVADKASLYLLIFIPGLIGTFAFRGLRSYVQVQGIVYPPVVTSCVCMILHIIFNLIFVKALKLKLIGVAVASSLSTVCMAVALGLYIYFGKVYRKTWFGCTKLCLMDWSTFVMMSLFSMMSILLKPLANETTVILMGVVSTDTQAAQAILNQVRFVSTLSPVSVGLSMFILTGQELGAGNPVTARTIAKCGLFINIVIGSVLSILLLSCRSLIGHIFTDDPTALTLTYDSLPLAVLAIFLESVYLAFFYLTHAIGKPYISIVSNLLGYYVVALPLGSVLTFVKNMGLNGMWIGMSTGLFFQIILLNVILYYRTNFHRESVAARRRAGSVRTKKISRDYGSTRSRSVSFDERTSYGNVDGSVRPKKARSKSFDESTSNSNVDGVTTALSKSDDSLFLIEEDEEVPSRMREDDVQFKDILLKCLVFLGGIAVLILGVVIRLMVNG